MVRKLLEEGLGALSLAELSIAWASVEGLLNFSALQYATYKRGLRSEELAEEGLTRTASMLCYFPTLSRAMLGNDEFGLELKKRAAKIDCSELPSPLWDGP